MQDVISLSCTVRSPSFETNTVVSLSSVRATLVNDPQPPVYTSIVAGFTRCVECWLAPKFLIRQQKAVYDRLAYNGQTLLYSGKHIRGSRPLPLFRLTNRYWVFHSQRGVSSALDLPCVRLLIMMVAVRRPTGLILALAGIDTPLRFLIHFDSGGFHSVRRVLRKQWSVRPINLPSPDKYVKPVTVHVTELIHRSCPNYHCLQRGFPAFPRFDLCHSLSNFDPINAYSVKKRLHNCIQYAYSDTIYETTYSVPTRPPLCYCQH